MKSLQLLLLLTPLACLLAQAPPASQPANPPAPAGQPAKPPAVALQPPAPAVAHVPPETVVLTIGEEKITAADLDRMIDMLPEQYRAQMRTTGRRQFAERLVSLKVMAQEAHRRKLEDTPAYKSTAVPPAPSVTDTNTFPDLTPEGTGTFTCMTPGTDPRGACATAPGAACPSMVTATANCRETLPLMRLSTVAPALQGLPGMEPLAGISGQLVRP